MDVYKIVKKLIGEIEPVGESNTDTERLYNLRDTIELIKDLLYDVEKTIKHKDRSEESMKKIGEISYRFRNSLKD